jgi:transposase-like protein
MVRVDELDRLLEQARGYANCPGQLIAGSECLLAELSASSSLTSRRYSVWSVVRRNMDDAFLESLAGFTGEWNQELLANCRLSEMGKYAPSIRATPNGTTDPAYCEAWANRGKGWLEGVLGSCQAPHLQPETPRRPFNDGWDFRVVAKRLDKPSNVTPMDWQIRNIDLWAVNIQCALQNLCLRTVDAREIISAFDFVLYELIPLLKRFRPTRTTTHPDHESLPDAQTRSDGGSYCELCWCPSMRTAQLDSLRWSVPDHQKRPGDKINAGKLSNRYCSVHSPGSARYHADLRYKAALQHHMHSMVSGEWRNSDYPLSFSIDKGFDEQEIRKTAYDQVHSRLHANAPPGEATQGLREKIAVMLTEGLNQSEIARRLGVSRQAISKARKSLDELISRRCAGMELDPRTSEASVSASVLSEIRAALQRKLSISAIAREVGLMKHTVDGLVRLIRAGNL